MADVQLAFRAKDRTKGATDSVKSRVAGVAKAVAAAFAGREMIRFFSDSIRLSREQEMATRSLEVALGRFSGTSAETTREIMEFAGALQTQVGIGDEVIQQMQTLLLNFGVMPDKINAATEAAANLASVAQISVIEATRRLGRTLSGSVDDVSKFADEIKGLTKEQLAAGGAIDIINEKYAGFAKDALPESELAMRNASNAWGDFKEAIGAAITESDLFITSSTQVGDQLSAMTGILTGQAGAWDQLWASIQGRGQEQRVLEEGRKNIKRLAALRRFRAGEMSAEDFLGSEGVSRPKAAGPKAAAAARKERVAARKAAAKEAEDAARRLIDLDSMLAEGLDDEVRLYAELRNQIRAVGLEGIAAADERLRAERQMLDMLAEEEPTRMEEINLRRQLAEKEHQQAITEIRKRAALDREAEEAAAAKKTAQNLASLIGGGARAGADAGAAEPAGVAVDSVYLVAGINSGFAFLQGFQQALESGQAEDVLGIFLDLIQTILGFVPGGAAIGAVVGGVGGLVRSSVRSGGELHREQQLESRRRGRR